MGTPHNVKSTAERIANARRFERLTSQHTPGPWHWDSDPVKGDPTGRVRYRVCALGKTITQVYSSSFEGGPTNAEADARLIASAPDLLIERDAMKALNTELVEVLDGCVDSQECNGYIGAKMMEEARAILAKIT